jgi:hypothetical protein
MITEDQRNKLLEVLGTRHVSKVGKYFGKQKIYNRDNDPYSRIFISRVFNGKLNNAKVEAGIFAAVENFRIEQTAEMVRREEILKQAKKDQQDV